MKTKKKFTINIWDFIDIDKLNETLDDNLNLDNAGAVEIDYEPKKINKAGDLILIASFIKEKF